MGIPTLIGSAHTASNAASIDITSGIDSTYDEYMFVLTNISPATNGADFTFQCNVAGQSGFNETMTSSYHHAEHDESDGTANGPSYAAENNRQSQEGDHGIMICHYGSNPVVDGADEGTDLSGETSRGIFEPKSNKWFGGRGEILHASGDVGKFRVYAEGHSTTWDGDDYTFNVQGRLYYWAAFG